MKKTGLRIAQGAAVMFAIGVSAWIVILAHEGANDEPAAPPPPGQTPASEGDAAKKPSLEIDESSFFHSSKGAAGLPTEFGEAEEPVFLPSSKSAIGIAPKKKDKAKKTDPKKEPVFLPSSKSAPIRGPIEKPAESDK